MINIICEKCGNKDSVGDRVPYNRSRSNIPNYCGSCMKIYKSEKISSSHIQLHQHNPSLGELISKRAKERYSLLSDDKKDEIKKNLKQYREDFWGSISEEEKKDIYDRISNSNKLTWSNPDLRKELSLKIISYWNSLSDNKRKRISNIQSLAQKKVWDQKSEVDRIEKVRQLNEGFRNYWQSLTPIEIEEYRDRCRERFVSMSVEEKLIVSERHRQWWDDMSEEEKENFSNDRKQFYHSLSDEEKERWSQRAKDAWGNMTVEERNRLIASRTVGVRKYWENITPDQFDLWIVSHKSPRDSGPKPTETHVSYDLSQVQSSNLGFRFTSQYYNQEKHPEFDERFPMNPYNNNGRCSPYHRWDFFIENGKGRKYLLDVDGSIHNITPGKWVIDNFDIGAYTRFNDSKRPYQTDGMSAYVIMAYNDMIEDSTPVLSLDTGGVLSYKDLINIITP